MRVPKRLAQRQRGEIARGHAVLRLDPGLDLGRLERLHPAIRIVHAMAVVVVFDVTAGGIWIVKAHAWQFSQF